MRVLLVTVADAGSCSLGFAISMMRMQAALQPIPDVHVTIDVAPTLKAATRMAVEAGTFDVVVAVDSGISFPSSLVMRALQAPHAFVTGVYPLPSIDWDRVQDKRDAVGEDVRFRGNTYNLDAAQAKLVAGEYLEVAQAKLGCVILKKEAFECVANALGSTDPELCAAWGRPIHADLASQCAVSGTVEFTGCVGARAVLR